LTPLDQTSLLIWRVDSPIEFKRFSYALSYWLETKDQLIPVTKTGSQKRGKRLPLTTFKQCPTITLRRQTATLYSTGQKYLVLINISDIRSMSWMQSTFSTHCDHLTLELKKIESPHEFLRCFRFRELFGVSLYSEVLGWEQSQSLEKEVAREWTKKWTADEIVEGIKGMPFPDHRQEIPFLELARNATLDHSKEYYVETKYRWSHLTTEAPLYIKETLDDFQKSRKEKWATPTRNLQRRTTGRNSICAKAKPRKVGEVGGNKIGLEPGARKRQRTKVLEFGM
jgi:hypothetical protein